MCVCVCMYVCLCVYFCVYVCVSRVDNNLKLELMLDVFKYAGEEKFHKVGAHFLLSLHISVII